MLVIDRAGLKTLIDCAEAAYPDEACALLIGRRGPGDDRLVETVILSPNVAPDRSRNFEVDPGVRIGVERELRGGVQQIVGLWHSHPQGRAEPSATDVAMAYEPELAWLVSAVYQGEVIQTSAFMLCDDKRRFRPMAMYVMS